MSRLLVAIVLVVASLFGARTAFAHKPSDSYVTLEVDGAVVHGRWDVALRDFDYALGVDANGDGKITWGELRGRQGELAAYALAHLTLRGDDRVCPLVADPKVAVVSHSDGTYAVLRFDARCDAPVQVLSADYRLFFDLDPLHRGILRVEGGGASRAETVSASSHEARFDLKSSGRGRQFVKIVKEGIIHIWEGYDHVLFLLALLLPSVLRRQDKGWAPVPALKPAIFDVLRIVTAFTVAHSITLSLAALGVVTLPSRLVESAIAASVVLAALNNLWPILRQDRWMAAFLLGLMHGFGFSSTLMDLELPQGSLVTTLSGFNLGVEIGQVTIVCIFVPLAFAARRTLAYRRVGLVAGSVAIGVLAMVWLIERAFVVKIIT